MYVIRTCICFYISAQRLCDIYNSICYVINYQCPLTDTPPCINNIGRQTYYYFTMEVFIFLRIAKSFPEPQVKYVVFIKDNKKSNLTLSCFNNGAGSGNRTHLSSLEGWSITDIRYLHIYFLYPVVYSFIILYIT